MQHSDRLELQCDNVRTPITAHCHNRVVNRAGGQAVKGLQHCAVSAHYMHFWRVARTLLAGVFFAMCDCAMSGNAQCHITNLHPHNDVHIEVQL